MENLEQGLLPGSVIQDNLLYHSDLSHISSSGCKLINRSPLHYYSKYYKKEEDETEIIDKSGKTVGSIVHTCILEAKTIDSSYIVAPEVDRRTNAGKAKWAEFLGEAGEKQIITQAMWDKAQKMRDNVMLHPTAGMYFEELVTEQAFYYLDPETGAPAKIKLDQWDAYMELIVDLKTTRDASPKGFGREAAKYEYDLSGAMYKDGLQVASNGLVRPKGFVIVAVENEAPHAVACYAFGGRELEEGRRRYRNAMRLFTACLENNAWPGYAEDTQPLMLPSWFKNQNQ